jgi:rfaE bifunctional protein nucleotidyltransferase chain/domain
VSARIVEHHRDLAPILAAARRDGGDRSVALTNGCFDLLHVGHVRLIREAATLADLLVVALNSDASARENKGPGRPVLPIAERMELVAAIAGVDFVTSFDEPTAAAVLAALRPELHVKGTDWTAETVPERDVVLGYGGRIAIAGDAKSHSSSDVIRRARGAGSRATKRTDGSRG